MGLPGMAPPTHDRTAIQAEAAAWVIRLDSAPADDVRAAADAWIDASPHHAVAFAAASLAWETASRSRVRAAPELEGCEPEDAPADPPAPIAASDDAPADARRPVTRRGAVGLLAAAAVGSVGLGLSRYADLMPDRHRTGRGQQSRTRLADGTSIALNTDTLLDTRLDGSERRVRLLAGEAMFDVARDVRRPFVVDLGTARIRVLGTRFNIRRLPDRIELTVTHGLVSVLSGNGQSVRAAAGDTALIRPDMLATTRLDDGSILRRVAWQDGYIELDEDTLEQAVDEFNRYRERPIVIVDPRLTPLMVSGRFGVRESAAFLTALTASFQIRVTPVSDGSIALSRS